MKSGGKKEGDLSDLDLCPKCHGFGGRHLPGNFENQYDICPRCNGSGKKVRERKIIGDIINEFI